MNNSEKINPIFDSSTNDNLWNKDKIDQEKINENENEITPSEIKNNNQIDDDESKMSSSSFISGKKIIYLFFLIHLYR